MELIDRAYFTASMNGSEMLRRMRALIHATTSSWR